MENFSAKVEDGCKGGDGKPAVGPTYRGLLSKDEFPPLDRGINTTWDIFRVSVEKHEHNKMLGWRKTSGEKLGPYLWKTYKEVYEEVLLVGSAIRSCGAEPGSKIGIYGANCPQWIVAMEACNGHSFVCVPLYDTLGAGAVNYIIEHAEIEFVFVQDKKAKELLNSDCVSIKQLKSIICFTSFSEDENAKFKEAGIKPYSWDEFLQMGKKKTWAFVPPEPHNICTIMYTSGTSGDPKGVILTHENLTAFVRGVDLFMEQFDDKMTVNDVYLSFLPLAHILDRMIEEYFFHKGASVGYYHGNLNELREDLMELKPTFLAGVPRVFDRIYEGIQKALEELNPVRRRAFDLLYNHKLRWMKAGYKQKDASRLADLLAFRKVKARLGGRLRLVISGGAPLSPEVEEFLRVTCCSFFVTGYGLTETCGAATIGYPDEMCMLGTAGAVGVYNELRLEEVPEMGYHPFDNPSRGEICVRGKIVFGGYYKNPELTAESIRDGWFHTGDIGELLPNGTIKIIDRKKNLIKLSQGEYVALEHLENIYGASPIIEDIWVYGDSFKTMLVAVVVPNEENTKTWASKNGYAGKFSELCSQDQLNLYILSELKAIAEKKKLRGFERIKGIIVEQVLFELQKDLMTATLKKRRNKLLDNYKVEIDQLYKTLAARK